MKKAFVISIVIIAAVMAILYEPAYPAYRFTFTINGKPTKMVATIEGGKTEASSDESVTVEAGQIVSIVVGVVPSGDIRFERKMPIPATIKNFKVEMEK